MWVYVYVLYRFRFSKLWRFIGLLENRNVFMLKWLLNLICCGILPSVLVYMCLRWLFCRFFFFKPNYSQHIKRLQLSFFLLNQHESRAAMHWVVFFPLSPYFAKRVGVCALYAPYILPKISLTDADLLAKRLCIHYLMVIWRFAWNLVTLLSGFLIHECIQNFWHRYTISETCLVCGILCINVNAAVDSSQFWERV